MPSEPLRWGLLSTARINRAVIPPLQASARNRLVAVASRDRAVAEAYAADKGIERAYGSYEELLADPGVDVVYNPLPNHLHAPWTIAACEAGKHVLCEKPLAPTVEEIDAMAAAARANGVVVTEAFMYRHHPQTLEVRRLVAAGAIGEVRLVNGSFSFPLTRPGDIRLDPAMGGGSLWDVGGYPLSFARTVLADGPVEVSGWQRTGESGVDMTFAGRVRFAGGAVAQIDSSFEAPFRTRIEVIGTEGTITVPSPFLPRGEQSFTITQVDGTVQTIEIADADLYAGEIDDLASAVLDGTTPRIGLDDSRVNVATILALLRSAADGGRPTPVT